MAVNWPSVFSAQELAALWVAVGGNPAQASTAAAVALAESSGKPNATNSNTNGTTDRGLWQINSVHGSQSTFDPIANAKAAVAISNNGANWAPWTTFNTGAYHQFLSQAQSAVTNSGFQTLVTQTKQLISTAGGSLPGIQPGPSGQGSFLSKPFNAVSGAVSAASTFAGDITNPQWWLHVLEVIAGAVVLILGLRSLGGSSTRQNIRVVTAQGKRVGGALGSIGS